MRILWDSGNVGFGGCGINEWDRQMISHLRRENHEVCVVVDDLLLRRPKFHKWNPPEGGYTRFNGKIETSNFKKVYEDLGPFDIQIGNHFTMFPVCEKVLPVVHDVDIPGREEYSLSISLTLRGLSKLTNTFACTTPFIQKQVLEIIPGANTKCLYSGSKFSGGKLTKFTTKSPPKPYMVYWGNRYEKSKNFTALLKTLKDHDLDLRVSSFKPPSVKELEAIRGMKLEERVMFYDSLSDQELCELITQSEMYVCPSKYEGMGLPVIEAMSLGVPVVVAPCASLPEIVGDCGYIADSSSYKDLSKEILKCVENKEETKAKVKRALVKSESWTWKNSCNSLLLLAQEVIGS